jgi:3-methylfumaryl-CoA hydratase
MDFEALKQWIGRTSVAHDHVASNSVAALAATLDWSDPPPAPGSALPCLWHWMYFNPAVRQSELGADGHPARGGFLPPVPLPRRMWAGGRVAFHSVVRVGDRVSRSSRIEDVSHKEGRSGSLVFVRVCHEVVSERGLAITEEHDIVYREQPKPGMPLPALQPAPSDHAWRFEIRPDPVLLFRYSALTFNGHRIHYDRPYATGEEGYPGLVVHGPLIATLLLEGMRRAGLAGSVAGFEYRALRPLFDADRFHVCGKPAGDGTVRLWAAHADGALCMDATATLGPHGAGATDREG